MSKSRPVSNATIAIILILLSIIGVAVGFVLNKVKSPEDEKPKRELPAYLGLPKDVKSSISGSDPGVVVVGITLELQNQEQIEKTKVWVPLITAEVGSYLSRQSMSKLEGPSNMERVSDDIKESLNKNIQQEGLSSPVKSVLFTKYITQR